MKSWLILAFILALPHLLFAADGVQTKKPKHHKKQTKKVAVHHSKIKPRYKLVAYKAPNGKLRHKYVDTRPEKSVPPPTDLYPEAPPSLPQMETQFIPSHQLTKKDLEIDKGFEKGAEVERTPSSDKIDEASLDHSKESFPNPEMH